MQLPKLSKDRGGGHALDSPTAVGLMLLREELARWCTACSKLLISIMLDPLAMLRHEGIYTRIESLIYNDVNSKR